MLPAYLAALPAVQGVNTVLAGITPNHGAAKNRATQSDTEIQQDFQKYLLQAQTRTSGHATLQDLVGLQGKDLQTKLAALSPQDQQKLAQSLLGAHIQVQDAGGQTTQGEVSKIQLEGTPKFELNGRQFQIGQITSILQLGNFA